MHLATQTGLYLLHHIFHVAGKEKLKEVEDPRHDDKDEGVVEPGDGVELQWSAGKGHVGEDLFLTGDRRENFRFAGLVAAPPVLCLEATVVVIAVLLDKRCVEESIKEEKTNRNHERHNKDLDPNHCDLYFGLGQELINFVQGLLNFS